MVRDIDKPNKSKIHNKEIVVLTVFPQKAHTLWNDMCDARIYHHNTSLIKITMEVSSHFICNLGFFHCYCLDQINHSADRVVAQFPMEYSSQNTSSVARNIFAQSIYDQTTQWPIADTRVALNVLASDCVCL